MNDKVKKIFEVMQVIRNGQVQLDSYQFQDVAYILYNKCKERRIYRCGSYQLGLL